MHFYVSEKYKTNGSALCISSTSITSTSISADIFKLEERDFLLSTEQETFWRGEAVIFLHEVSPYKGQLQIMYEDGVG
jgi:hypothetical protein